jgi:hypothetical protein
MRGRGWVFAAFGAILLLGLPFGWFPRFPSIEIGLMAMGLFLLSLPEVLCDLGIVNSAHDDLRWKWLCVALAALVFGLVNVIWPWRPGSSVSGYVLVIGATAYLLFLVFVPLRPRSIKP